MGFYRRRADDRKKALAAENAEKQKALAAVREKLADAGKALAEKIEKQKEQKPHKPQGGKNGSNGTGKKQNS